MENLDGNELCNFCYVNAMKSVVGTPAADFEISEKYCDDGKCELMRPARFDT